jgi:hypothetical protein
MRDRPPHDNGSAPQDRHSAWDPLGGCAGAIDPHRVTHRIALSLRLFSEDRADFNSAIWRCNARGSRHLISPKSRIWEIRPHNPCDPDKLTQRALGRLRKKAAADAKDRRGRLSHNPESALWDPGGTGLLACWAFFRSLLGVGQLTNGSHRRWVCRRYSMRVTQPHGLLFECAVKRVVCVRDIDGYH